MYDVGDLIEQVLSHWIPSPIVGVSSSRLNCSPDSDYDDDDDSDFDDKKEGAKMCMFLLLFLVKLTC